jgi:hypothetical protein
MKAVGRPKNWKQISDDIRFHRANDQCECNYHCHSNNHTGRCTHMHGVTPTGWKKAVALQVTTMQDANDFRPENLIAMCDQCYKDHAAWKIKRDAERERMRELADQMDPLFDLGPQQDSAIREQN